MGPDMFALAAGLITAVVVIALVVSARWVTARNDRQDENLIPAALVVLTVIGVAAVLVAAVSGPHPS